MNPIQLLANLRRNTPEMQAALSRDTTECYLEQLRKFEPPKSSKAPDEILRAFDIIKRDFDEYHGGAE